MPKKSCIMPVWTWMALELMGEVMKQALIRIVMFFFCSKKASRFADWDGFWRLIVNVDWSS